MKNLLIAWLLVAVCCVPGRASAQGAEALNKLAKEFKEQGYQIMRNEEFPPTTSTYYQIETLYMTSGGDYRFMLIADSFATKIYLRVESALTRNGETTKNIYETTNGAKYAAASLKAKNNGSVTINFRVDGAYPPGVQKTAYLLVVRK